MNGVSPNWAREEVDKRVPCQLNAYSASWEWSAYASHLRDLAASLIEEHEEHEEKPIDPLLEEAREVAAKYYLEEGCPSAADKCRSGEWDHMPFVEVTVEGLRRGIELGKAGAA